MIRSLLPRLAILLIAATMLGATPASADYPPGEPPETVPFGRPGEVTDYWLTVVNVDVDAGDLIRTYDPSVPVDDATSLVMIQIEATYTGDSVGHPGGDMSYSLLDSSGRYHDLLHHACPAWPFSPDSVALTPGQTGRFNLCFAMPAGAISTDQVADSGGPAAELIVFTNLITDQWPVGYSLDEPASPLDPDAPDCGCAPAPGDITG